MLTGLRPSDALVAWVINAGALLAAGMTATPAGWALEGALRLGAVALVFGWLHFVRDLRVGEFGQLFETSPPAIRNGTVLGLSFFVVSYLLVVGIQLIDRSPNLVDGTWNPWVATRSLVSPSVAFLAVFSLIGPFVEEVVHRGVAYPALKSRWNIPLAAGVSSAVFALGHTWEIFDLVNAFGLGLLTIWLLERHRSLSPAIAGHAASNLAVVVTGWSLYHLFGIPGSSLG